MNKLEKYLSEFSTIAQDWFNSVPWLQPQYEFFRKFFDPAFLRSAEWKDFQEMGDHLHCFNSLAIAKNKALGKPNHSIEQYRNAFEYLVRGNDPTDVRLDKLRDSSSPYYLKYFGTAALSELIGNALPEQYVYYNRRDLESVKFLDLSFSFIKGDTFGKKFVKFNDALQPAIVLYNSIVGLRTNTTKYLELDQFFSWLYNTHIKPFKGNDDFMPILQKFITQAETNDTHRQGYPANYAEFRMKVGFGAGFAARIPWITFLKEPDTVRDGIFPAFYYFKAENQLFLAYGISEERNPKRMWPETGKRMTIDQWFIKNTGVRAIKYGTSFIKNVYNLNDDLEEETIEKDLSELLEEYRALKSGENFQLEDREPVVDGKRYWLFAPGENGRFWQEFLDKEIFAIGWDELEDISKYNSRDEIREELLENYPDVSGMQTNNSLCLWEFSKVIKPGDIVISKTGLDEYLGYGIVQSDYYFDASRKEYKHVRKIDWKKTGSWKLSAGQHTVKTLTDITKYPDYVNMLKRLIGIEQKATVDVDKIQYFWLNANPKIWKMEDLEVGDEQLYTSYNESGHKRNKYEYFQIIKPGDLVIGYETTPTKKALAVFEVTRSLFNDDDDGKEKISFKILNFLPQPVSWETMKGMEELENSEVMRNNQGSLFKLTKEEFDAILNKDHQKENSLQKYTIDEAEKDIFLTREELQNVHQTLKYKKNIILQGPPGVGKTYMAKRLAFMMMEQMDKSKIEMVQFHQSYSYEDFIQGFRPVPDGSFRLENGLFYRFCKRAQADPGHDYFFIIDEINRGNLSKIFGELMLLIEADKRGEDYGVALTYSNSAENRFYIPANLYLIGTMNTADRSLAVVDYALRRRFAFINVNPCFNDKFRKELSEKGVEDSVIQRLCDKINQLNKEISKDFGDGFRIGHSYFCNVPDNTGNVRWYNSIVNNELVPLITEYWFDKTDKIETETRNLQFS